MSKFAAFINLIGGLLFALIGAFVIYRTCSFLSAAPRDHEGMIAWAFMIIVMGICLVIGGLRHVFLGLSQMQDAEMPEDY
jgi:hypothetical protein